MIAFDAVPLVTPDDNGIRLAGRPDECFYCRSGVGQPHSLSCVCLTAKVRYHVTAKLSGGVRFGSWETYDPWAWFNAGGDEDDVEFASNAGHWKFARNESSWCADNANVEWDDADTNELLEAAMDAAKVDCLCSYLEFELDAVLDNRFHVLEPTVRTWPDSSAK